MEKTKLGISVGLMGALVFLVGLVGGYVASILVAGYVLLREDNRWLKEMAIKSVTVLVGFGLVSALIGLLPEAFSFIQSFVQMFDGYLDTPAFFNQFVNVLTILLAILKTVVFVVLAWKALKQQTISVPLVDTLLKKHTEE